MTRTAYEISLPKTIEQLRRSSYHHQLGAKIFASFVAQQQGIRVESALKNVGESVGDLWLVLADLARHGGLGESPIKVCFEPAEPVTRP